MQLVLMNSSRWIQKAQASYNRNCLSNQKNPQPEREGDFYLPIGQDIIKENNIVFQNFTPIRENGGDAANAD